MCSHRRAKAAALVATCASVTIGLPAIGCGGAAVQGSGHVPASPTGSCVRAFAPRSPWNTSVAAGAAVDPSSATDMSLITSDRPLSSDPTQYTLPVYYASNATPLVPVTYTDGWYSDATGGGSVLTDYRSSDPSLRVMQAPIPPGTVGAAGYDDQAIVINTDTGEEWDLSQLQANSSGGYSALSVGHYDITWSGVPPYAQNNGDPYWIRGSRVPYLTGLIRPCEIAQGHIDHALALAIPQTAPQFVYPATGSDGKTSGGVPEGSHLQLDPTISDATIKNTWGCTGACFTVAKAMQRYGMYLIDGGGKAKVYFEYDGTAHWNGVITASTVSPIPLADFRILAPSR